MGLVKSLVIEHLEIEIFADENEANYGTYMAIGSVISMCIQ